MQLCRDRLYRIPRQGIRVSRVGAEVDAILRPGDFPSPNQSLVIGKERTLTGDQLFHQKGCLGLVGREASNLIEMQMVVEHVRKDHCVPDCEGQI